MCFCFSYIILFQDDPNSKKPGPTFTPTSLSQTWLSNSTSHSLRLIMRHKRLPRSSSASFTFSVEAIKAAGPGTVNTECAVNGENRTTSRGSWMKYNICSRNYCISLRSVLTIELSLFIGDTTRFVHRAFTSRAGLPNSKPN